jgi:hypothetical protein
MCACTLNDPIPDIVQIQACTNSPRKKRIWWHILMAWQRTLRQRESLLPQLSLPSPGLTDNIVSNTTVSNCLTCWPTFPSWNKTRSRLSWSFPFDINFLYHRVQLNRTAYLLMWRNQSLKWEILQMFKIM